MSLQTGFAPTPPMRKTPVVLGILSIVFGSLLACYQLVSGMVLWLFSGIARTVFGALGEAAKEQPRAAEFMKLFPQMMDILMPYTVARIVMYAVVGALLIVVGWGLYQRRWWARAATLAWVGVAFASIFASLAMVAVVQGRLMELMKDVFEQALRTQLPSEIRDPVTWPSALFTIVLQGAFPVVLAVFVGRPSAKADLLVREDR